MDTRAQSDSLLGGLGDSAFVALGDGEADRIAAMRRAKEDIEHMFRYSLQRNHINPLMHLVWRYRKLTIREAQNGLG